MSNKTSTTKGKTKPAKETKGKTLAAEKQPTALVEIVPGKFNENDWNFMLETEDSQEYVWEIIDEIFDSTLNIIHNKYLESQKIPFNINEARKAILHIIDWQFIAKDVNDDLTEVWVEDEEPEACIIDNWAQGYVQYAQIEKSNEQQSEFDPTNNEFLRAADSISSLSQDNARRKEGSDRSELDDDDDDSDYDQKRGSNKSKSRSSQNQLKTKAKSSTKKNKERLMIKQREKKESSESGGSNNNNQNSIAYATANSANDMKSIRTTTSTTMGSLSPMKLTSSMVKRNHGDLTLDLIDDDVDDIAMVDRELDDETAMRSVVANRQRVRKQPSVATSETKIIEEAVSKAPLACQSLLKSLLNKNASLREIEIDADSGQIKSVSKFDFDKLPSSNVKPRFSIINEIKPANYHEHVRKNKQDVRVHHLNSDEDLKNRGGIDEEQEILLEPATGVVFKMVNATRTGPKKTVTSNKQQLILEKTEHLLRPIKEFNRASGNRGSLERTSMEDILLGSPTVVKPKYTKPIPPISTHVS